MLGNPGPPKFTKLSGEFWKWLYLFWAWVRNLRDLLVQMVPAGYGGIRGEGVAGNSLGSSFDLLDYPYDADVIATPKGVVQDFANGTIAFTIANVWQVNVLINMEHDDVNRGRSVVVRLVNLTTLDTSVPIRVAIGRNQPGTFISFSALAEITQAAVDGAEPYALEIGDVQRTSGSADTLTNIVYGNIRLEAVHVSEVEALL